MKIVALIQKHSRYTIPIRFPKLRKRFCEILQSSGLQIENCPVDRWRGNGYFESSKGENLKASCVWRRYGEVVDWDGPVIQSPKFAHACSDKRETYKLLLSAHPMTYLGSEFFSLGLQKKYVVKPRFGQRKQGIQIAYGGEIIDNPTVLTDQWIIQEYIETYHQNKPNHDIRCIFYGSILIGSRIRRGDSIFDSRNNQAIELDPDMKSWVTKQAHTLLKKTQTVNGIYSVDIGINAKTKLPFVIECNSAVGIHSLFHVDENYDAIIKYLNSVL